MLYYRYDDEDKAMSNFTITIELPEELVERAKQVGIELSDQSAEFIAVLEAQIKRREAGERLRKIGEQLQALPPELKPSLEEIEAEIRAYRAEQREKENMSP
jgi:predicted nucleotidyltransferase